MESFDESYKDEEPRESSGWFSWLALAVGVLGLILGVTGLIVANNSMRQVTALKTELAEKPDMLPELRKETEALSERLELLGSEFVKLNRQDRTLQENTQKAFSSVTRDIKENRDALNAVTQRFSELTSKLESGGFAHAKAKAAPVREEGGAVPDEPQGGESPVTYQIRSGDTLSRVAKEFGVSLQELMEANPSVNPRALQIGQEILIPGQ